MNIQGYKRINQTPLTAVNERIIVLRKSINVIDDLLLHEENTDHIAALQLSKQRIEKEIEGVISRLTIRS